MLPPCTHCCYRHQNKLDSHFPSCLLIPWPISMWISPRTAQDFPHRSLPQVYVSFTEKCIRCIVLDMRGLPVVNLDMRIPGDSRVFVMLARLNALHMYVEVVVSTRVQIKYINGLNSNLSPCSYTYSPKNHFKRIYPLYVFISALSLSRSLSI